MAHVDTLTPGRPSQMGPGEGAPFAYGTTVTSASRVIELVVARSFPGAGVLVRNDILITAPAALAGSHIVVAEHAGRCAVDVRLRTAADWLSVAPAHQHEAIPLVGIGYLDVMSRPHPALPPDGGGEHAPRVEETLDAHGRVVRRQVHLDDGRVRTWLADFQGDDDLPVSATVSLRGAQRPGVRLTRVTPRLSLAGVAAAELTEAATAAVAAAVARS